MIRTLVLEPPPTDAMTRRPRLRSDRSVEQLHAGVLVLLSDVQHWVLEGPVYPRLVPLLDGTRTIPAIAEALRDHANAAEVRAALWILERDGHVHDPAQDRDDWRPRLALSTVGFDEEAWTPDFVRSLGFSTDLDTDVTVVVTDDYLRQPIAEFASRTDRPWVPIKPFGTVLWAGPLIRPPLTPCWNCLRQRIEAHRPAHAWLEAHRRLPRGRMSEDAAAARVPIALQALSSQLRWAHAPAKAPRPWTSLVSVDPRTLRLERHRVLRQPECPLCNPWVQAGAPARATIALQSRPRTASSDGGWRTLSPARTFRRYRHHISAITGVVSHLYRRTSPSSELTLFSADYLFPPDAGGVFPVGRRRSAGKGVGRAQARTSALCEALERYSGTFRGTEARQAARYEELADVAIAPNACANFSERQYEHREAWNANPCRRTWVPERFDHTQAIEWTASWSLTNDACRYLPTAQCYYGYPQEKARWCRADSNGCAAGNTLEEAILQGFLELAERDAVAIWWYNEIESPEVDLTTLSHPFVEQSVASCHRSHRSLRVIDLTNDLGIPVFAAVSESADSGRAPLLLGFGAHLDQEVAVLRALTELNQWRSGIELGTPVVAFSGSGAPGAFLRRSSAMPQPLRETAACRGYDDIGEAVRACVNRAAAAGLETLVLDQTREDVGLRVVRVVVPGLRHFWPRFGPGRLYTVPVDLGWVREPTDEGRLNRVHIVI